MSTSSSYKILKFVVGLMNAKKLFALPKDELLKKAAAFNKNRDFRIPKDHQWHFSLRAWFTLQICFSINPDYAFKNRMC